jgi:hypothetical protein
VSFLSPRARGVLPQPHRYAPGNRSLGNYRIAMRGVCRGM